MNDELLERGLAIRKSGLGAEYVENSIASADDFNMPMQRLVTGYFHSASRAKSLPNSTAPSQNRWRTNRVFSRIG